MLEAIFILTLVVFFSTVAIGSQILRVILRLDKIINVLKQEQTANARHRVGR